jgi:hypothetical protein
MPKRVDEYNAINTEVGATALGARPSTGQTVRYNIGKLGTAAAADTGTASAEVPTNADLGSAADADVTTSPTDQTSGRVMRVDDYPSDTAWTTTTSLSNGWTGAVRYIKRAGMVTVDVDADGSSKTGNTMFTLPSAYRPSVTVDAAAQQSGKRVIIGNTGVVDSDGNNLETRALLTYPVF